MFMYHSILVLTIKGWGVFLIFFSLQTSFGFQNNFYFQLKGKKTQEVLFWNVASTETITDYSFHFLGQAEIPVVSAHWFSGISPGMNSQEVSTVFLSLQQE